jgi:hypothetical protein
MAARRLLIVMLILLGLSTLAAALVPPRSLREGSTGPASTTRPTTTTASPPPPSGRSLAANIIVGATKETGTVPRLIRACLSDQPKVCTPIRVGDQLSLVVYSRKATQLEIPALGLVQAVAPEAPARFELLPDSPDIYGVLFAPSQKVAAQIKVLPRGHKRGRKPGKGPAKPAARAGSGRA